MNRDFIKRLTANSNQHARDHLDAVNQFAGCHWRNITVGVTLKMSIDDCRMGGYISYFQPQHHLYLSSMYHLQLGYFDPWAVKIFSLQRFKQIFDEGGIALRSRYCPVRKYNKDKPDKFHVELFCLANCDNKTGLWYAFAFGTSADK